MDQLQEMRVVILGHMLLEFTYMALTSQIPDMQSSENLGLHNNQDDVSSLAIRGVQIPLSPAQRYSDSALPDTPPSSPRKPCLQNASSAFWTLMLYAIAPPMRRPPPPPDETMEQRLQCRPAELMALLSPTQKWCTQPLTDFRDPKVLTTSEHYTWQCKGSHVPWKMHQWCTVCIGVLEPCA